MGDLGQRRLGSKNKKTPCDSATVRASAHRKSLLRLPLLLLLLLLLILLLRRRRLILLLGGVRLLI